MDVEKQEETVAQPTEGQGEPPSAKEDDQQQEGLGETVQEVAETSEETTEPAASDENDTAVAEEEQVTAAESEETAGEKKEEAINPEDGERDPLATAESGQAEGGERAIADDEEEDRESRAQTTADDPEPPQTESSSTPKETQRKEKEKKKPDKKRKKTKTPREEGTRGSPRSRKKGAKSRGGHRKQMEEILISAFLPFDADGSGTVDSAKFWEILQSPELNLQLEPQALAALQEVVIPDRSGLVPYAEFAAQASDIISSLYHDKPPSEEYSVRMATPSGHRVLSYNKQTAEFQDLVEEGVDPFKENIQGLYQSADPEGRGYITREEFIALFQLEQLALLTETDHSEMTQYFDQIAPEGKAQYTEFYGLGKELILRLYRNHEDTTDSEWLELQSEELGRYQLNKYTGEVLRDPAPLQASLAAQPQIDLINQAYHQAQEAVYEVEQYKAENRDLQNQLKLMTEEQETLAMQLEQTGHVLDEANAEIREKEEEIKRMQALLVGREHEVEDLMAQLAEAEVVREKLNTLEHELESAQEEVEARGQTMEERDSSMATLKTQSHRIVEKLKNAWADVEARDSSIVKLKHQLHTEQTRMKTYQEQTPLLESKVSELEAEVKRLNQLLEEKNTAFNTSRKHLKNARERNMELERAAEKAVQTEDKLKGAESEIRTLKGLLMSKTAMVERRKKELAETRVRLQELEERDRRRATILAEVLEKTAREYQHSLEMGGARGAESVMKFDQSFSLSSSQNTSSGGQRPVSAPAFPPDQPPQPHTLTPGTSPPGHPSHYSTGHPPRIMRTYTMPGVGVRGSQATRGSRTHRKGDQRSRTVPKLPPIRRRDLSKSLPLSSSFSGSLSANFHVPTVKEATQLQRQRDRQLVQHSESNPRCPCSLCMAGGATTESMEGGVRLDEQVALAGLSGSSDKTLARQLGTGQRILVSMKKSDFDLEPQQYTGIVKYVGKIDSEFIDNRIYVGVKLDEPVGNTDGLVKGKRYFNCPAKHGRIVRLSDVMAILPKSGVSYRPLQTSTGKSPYATSAPTAHKRSRVKVT